MTPLVVAVLALLVTSAGGSWVSGRRSRRRVARRQQRALDTLGTIAARGDRPGAPLTSSDPAPQAHVRFVGPGDEEPAPTPRPLTGGWRPTRATGAAPFRSPAPRAVSPGAGLGADAAPAELPDGDDAGADVGSVRLVRPSAPDASTSGAALRLPPDTHWSYPASPDPAQEAPVPQQAPAQEPLLQEAVEAAAPPVTRPAARAAGPGRRRSPLAPPPPDPDSAAVPGVASDLAALAEAVTPPSPGAISRATRPAPGPAGWETPDGIPADGIPTGAGPVTGEPDDGTPTDGGYLHFDDLEPAADVAAAPLEPAVAGPVDPSERAEWASRLATIRAPQAAAPPRRAPSPDRARRRLLAVAVVAVVIVGAAMAAVATGAIGHGTHPTSGTSGGQAAGATSTPVTTAPGGGRSSGGTTTSSTTTSPAVTTAQVKLVSSSVGVSVYQVPKATPITLVATGPCWVEARSGDTTGPVVYTATMQAGATQSLTGPVWIRLGNPTAVKVTAGGTTVSPPVSNGSPYDLQFLAQ